MKLESLTSYLDACLDVSDHPDYETALNGLQVGGVEDVSRIVAAVDASERVVARAIEEGADLLLVHHGLFWSGLRPLVGRHLRKIRSLLDGRVALYSVHLPLDGHPELGNAALLARRIGLSIDEGFGVYRGATVGWLGALEPDAAPEQLRERVGNAVGGEARLIAGGGDRIDRVAVVTGAGGSFLEEAVAAGADALVTGEASHHVFVDAMELGIHVILAGHYATETFGVQALAAHVAERFELDWSFVDDPSGL